MTKKRIIISCIAIVLILLLAASAFVWAQGKNLRKAESDGIYFFRHETFNNIEKVMERKYDRNKKLYTFKVKTVGGEIYKITIDMTKRDEYGNYIHQEFDKLGIEDIQ